MKDGTAKLICRAGIKNIPLSGKLVNVVEYCNKYFLLYDTDIYYCISLSRFNLYSITTCPIITNIKDVMSCVDGFYFVVDGEKSVAFPDISKYPSMEF